MSHFLSLSLLVLLVPPTGRTADEEPVLQNKKLSEWIEILRGDKAQNDRQTLMQALGCGANHTALWRPWLLQRRLAGLYAVALIGPQKSPKIFPALLTALNSDPESYIRRSAAQYLGRLGGKVHDDNKEMRGMPIKLDDVRDGLVTALRTDKSPTVREACAKSLGQLKESATSAVPALVAALRDPQEETQAAAAESLRILGKTLTVRDALPQLEEALKNRKTNTMAREQLVITLGIIGREVSVDNRVLLEVLRVKTEPDELRVVSATTLGILGKSSAVDELTRALGDKDSSLDLRRACLDALDTFGPDAKPALPELKKALQDKDKFIRTKAMGVIGRIGKELGAESKTLVNELLKITNDPVLEVRLAAIETLGNLGAETLGDDLARVVGRLEELVKDGQLAVRGAAENAKKKLKPEPANP